MICFMIMFSGGCHSQKDGDSDNLKNREPYAAGRFYESDSKQLNNTLKSLFEKAIQKKYNNVISVISPHAGYPFSGEVAASGFNQLDPEHEYENVFVIASSHSTSFPGASIYNIGNYITPLGTVKVNLELANKLVNDNEIFIFQRDAHLYEHSLEVQLPFLQYKLGDNFKLIPIVIGTQRKDDCEIIANGLRPYFNENNLFVVSTDFSHYPVYEDANKIDAITAKAILTKSPDKLRKTLSDNTQKGINNLATSLCGWSSVLSLLYLIQDEPDFNIHEVQYKNSGDAEYYGDKNRVVGYYSMVVTDNNQKPAKATKADNFYLSKKDKSDLLHIARETLEEYITNDEIPVIDETKLSDQLKKACGAFVTLNKDGKLRGCIGRFEVEIPLYNVVQNMAVSASTQDYRFSRVQENELKDLEIEISVLTPMKKISSVDDIVLNKHGIYIKKGNSSGTFLPQVASQTGWSKEEFLGHCSRDKARIGWDGWKDADVYIYEAIVFSENNH